MHNRVEHKPQKRSAAQTNRLHDKVGRYWAHILRRIRQPKFIVIVAHMRSGSSLLTHILNTNPEIAGYGENHLAYQSEKDLDRVVAKVMTRMKLHSIRESFFVDKVLHNHLEISQHLLDSGQCQLIYLLREPTATLASMLCMTHQVRNFHWDDYSRASSYYIQRLHNIMCLAMHSKLDNRAIFITHEQLIHSSQAVFNAIEKFLHLSTPLHEEYDILPTTGRPCIGDPTKRIKAARILRDKPVNQKPPFVPREVTYECELTFRAAVDVLATHCLSVDDLQQNDKAA